MASQVAVAIYSPEANESHATTTGVALDKDVKSITLLSSGGNTRNNETKAYFFDAVYDHETCTWTKENHMYGWIDPLLGRTMDGYNTAIAHINSSDSSPSGSPSGSSTHEMFFGDGVDGGEPGMIDRVLWTLFQEKGNDADLYVRAWEILGGEPIRDLMDPGRDTDLLFESAGGGIQLQGLKEVHVGTERQARETILSALRLRLGEATNFAHKAYVFISFLLKRQETGQHEVGMAGVESERAMSTSEFLVVDMPSSSYFGTDPGKVIVKEGAQMASSILALPNTLKSLSSTTTSSGHTSNISSHASTTYLYSLFEEILSGSTETRFLIRVDPDISDVTVSPSSGVLDLQRGLNLYQKLRNCVTYPVKMTFGLRMFYQRIKKKLVSQANPTSQPLQQTFSPTSLDRREKEWSSRFETLLHKKSTLESSLTSQKSLLLNTQKKLLDMEHVYITLEKTHTETVSSLEKQILSLEQEKAQNSSKMDSLAEECFLAKKELEGTRKDASESRAEVASVRANHTRLNKAYQDALLRNEEMGLELIHLLSVKEGLVQERQKYQAELETLSHHNQFLQKRLKKIEEDKLQEATNTTSSHDRRKSHLPAIHGKTELKPRVVGRAPVDETTLKELRGQLSTEKDKRISELNRFEEEKRRLMSQIEELKAKKRVSSAMERSSTVGARSDNDRVIMSLEARVNELLKEHQILQQEYRKELERLISELSRSSISGESQNQTILSDVFSQVVNSYQQHETQLLRQLRLQTDLGLAHHDMTDISSDGLKKQIKDFVMNTQLSLERERSSLLVKCAALEEQLSAAEAQIRMMSMSSRGYA